MRVAVPPFFFRRESRRAGRHPVFYHFPGAEENSYKSAANKRGALLLAKITTKEGDVILPYRAAAPPLTPSLSLLSNDISFWHGKMKRGRPAAPPFIPILLLGAIFPSKIKRY